MATLATLTVRVIGDVSDLQKKMDSAEKTTSRAMGAMKTAGVALTAAVTAPLVAFGVNAVNAASDLAESQNKVNVVFGESARVVTSFTNNAARSLGTSRQAALEAAGTFGNLFTSMGIGDDVSADMSTSLLTLAADLSSFNNIDPSEVFIKLRAGLVGEAEPLRTLGVNISAAAIELKAFELGLASTTDELTPAIKAQAAYALIMEQTTNAQGDFARTSEGFANQTRIMKAEFADLSATVGEMFLPYAMQLIEWVRSAVTWFQSLSAEKQKLIVIIAAVAAAIGPLLLIFSGLITAISTIGGAIVGLISFAFSPLGIVLILIAGLVFLLYQAWVNNWGGMRDTLTALWEGSIKPKLMELWAWLKENIPLAIERLRQFWENVLKPGMERFWNWVVSNVFPLLQELWNWLEVNVPKAIETLRRFWEEVLKPGIERFWSWVQANVIPKLEDLREWLETNIPKALETLRSFWEDTLQPGIKRVFDWMNEHLFPFIIELNDFIGATFGLTIAAFALLWETGLKPALETVWKFIKENVLPILQDLWEVIENDLAPKIGTFITNTLDWLTNRFRELKDWIEKATGWLWKLIDAIKNVPSKTIKVPGTGGITDTTGQALGGRVFANNAYMTGEHGMEAFFPQEDGVIVPHSKIVSAMRNVTGSNSGRQIVYQITTNTKYEPEQTLSEKMKLLTLLAG